MRHEASKSFDGYTLYTSGHDSAAFLIDMEGRVRHRWKMPFHSAWEEPPHVDRPVPEPFIHWRRAHLHANGDLIAMYEAAGDTPWGYGMVKVDRDSRLVWKVNKHVHHDMCVRSDGSMITLGHEWRDSHSDPLPGAPHLSRILMEDFVLVISPAGEVVQRVSLLEALARSDYANLLKTVRPEEWDVLHTNSVEMITPEFAAHHAFTRSGQVMVSFRSRHALAIVDLETAQVVWASCGPYRSQHDPDVMPNGLILLFDNRGHVGRGGPSRVVEFHPVSQAIHWWYAGSSEDPLYSHIRSAQQSLPNGNILITESDAGRILEVTRDHEVVWEFRNPASLSGEPPSIAIVCGAKRLAADEIQFEFNEGREPGEEESSR